MPTTTVQPTTSPQVTGLDGQTRDWADVFTYEPSHPHSAATVLGWVVRQTYFDRPKPHVDRASFLAHGEGYPYQDAITAEHWLRAHTDRGYAVIDTVHACGCRFNG